MRAHTHTERETIERESCVARNSCWVMTISGPCKLAVYCKSPESISLWFKGNQTLYFFNFFFVFCRAERLRPPPPRYFSAHGAALPLLTWWLSLAIRAVALQAALTMNSERPRLASADSQAGGRHDGASTCPAWKDTSICKTMHLALTQPVTGRRFPCFAEFIGKRVQTAEYPRWFHARSDAEKITQFSPSGVLHQRVAHPGWPLNSSLAPRVTSSS